MASKHDCLLAILRGQTSELPRDYTKDAARAIAALLEDREALVELVALLLDTQEGPGTPIAGTVHTPVAKRVWALIDAERAKGKSRG